MGCNNNYKNYNKNYYMRDSRDMNCGNYHEYIDNMPIAMAYVPWQKWNDVYDLAQGYDLGTIFPELDKPFLGRCM